MTARIIKASRASASALPPGWDRPAPIPDPERVRLRARIASLETQLGARDEAVGQLEEAAREAYRQGEAAGREAAVLAFENREQERLELLRQGIAQAVADHAAALAGSERLAVLIARECLERMLGVATDRTELVHDLIRHQYAQLEAQSVLAVRVSPTDFTALGAGGLDLRRDDRLAAGEVLFDLALGSVAAGIDQQWGAFRAVLSELAEAEG